ncbi:LLM class flavin-dependent oxidoreductase [Frankia sp. CNm7]|uniref:LLM class flavin-dependent oxidoreductase n=1 Tax=Frankia nepalensis TaxID=1836974 RepID=A0A937RIJ4_9ACTN|nr:LLM class flavin-dependent oxidoreductase [Frankia nepalensis]MBL7494905.1 LLM class flavin-dependent oxidoreductase [Frankia nepalensis]MBL7514425.1 LLM class flavin-dependent oxidoreductase [Frankia nepalensis]MBL7521177.1 LLM class flavin-dependent oxidoreductase [Frankia nepalensis]MBL7632898.1 LLM class flavin-dependent oxidoreductase [Frankia nepalensis]
MISVLRLNFAVPGLDRGALAASYQAGVEMARYAEDAGIAMVSLEEHHGADNGWSPAPLTNAGLILGATKKVHVIVQALLVPLSDPLRLAEQLAVLDLASRGRVTAVAGLGYRPEEYADAGLDWSRRGALLDESLAAILGAWTGEPFTYRGRTVRITPPPASPPAQLLWVGGSVKASARRAARLGLPLCPPNNSPELEAYYYEQCAEHGTSGFVIMPGADTTFVHVAEDPEKAWAELGEYFLHEATLYASWQPPGQTSAAHSHASTVDELRAEAKYRILSPDECVERARGGAGVTVLHPLCGGMPPERGWESLRLYGEKVLPRLAAARADAGSGS